MYASRSQTWTSWSFDWADKLPGAQLLLYELTGKQEYKSDVESFCDYAMSIKKSPKGQTHLAQWGSNRYASNFAFICLGVSFYFQTFIIFGFTLLGSSCRHQTFNLHKICWSTDWLHAGRFWKKLCNRLWRKFPQAASSQSCCLQKSTSWMQLGHLQRHQQG